MCTPGNLNRVKHDKILMAKDILQNRPKACMPNFVQDLHRIDNKHFYIAFMV